MSAEPRIIPPAAESPQPPVSNGQTLPATTHPQENPRPRAWELWLLRIRALLFVTLCATFGVLLVIVPWTPKWTDSPFLLTSPGLRDFVSSGFIRGLASGLGILDLWVGFWEAIHYHEAPRNTGS